MTYPFLLVPGTWRFDEALRALLHDDDTSADGTHYFRRIRSTLEAHGFVVRHSAVPWSASVSERAVALKGEVSRVLQETGAAKVHIIAHSMAGLDARHLLFEHRADAVHEKIASVTTLGTPHHGTSFADWGVTNTALVIRLLDGLGISALDGLRDLTSTSCTRFNLLAASFERTCGVLFQTCAGAQEPAYIFEPLKLPWHLIAHHEGPNDGLVSVASARWSNDYFRAPVVLGDHLNLLGWWEPNDLGLPRFPPGPPRGETRSQLETRIRRLYVDIANDLAARFPAA